MKTITKEANLICNKLENQIAELDCGLDYNEIVRVAGYVAIQIRENTPMYTGNLNPKWALYDEVVALLKGRIDIETANP